MPSNNAVMHTAWATLATVNQPFIHTSRVMDVSVRYNTVGAGVLGWVGIEKSRLAGYRGGGFRNLWLTP